MKIRHVYNKQRGKRVSVKYNINFRKKIRHEGKLGQFENCGQNKIDFNVTTIRKR